ncbi:oxygen-independent coproporphyrinogen III oxidase [Sphingomonas nostoxanthinifaciens]|nr:oxygen-independent coproporphyrinogen III oxidase [Sphingomonas nostoxanthinifaciens]
MVRYLPELAARAVPRYTSYPTAAEFNDDVGAAEQAAALAAIGADDAVSLYVHIPYCREICWYCGCTTGAVGRPDRLATYVDALVDEIDAVASRMAGRVTAIHLGGGSPNALAAEDMTRLMAALRDRFTVADDVEIAVELDPRTLDADYCALLGGLGVTRASLGVQTFAPAIQRRINRVQPYWTAAEAVRDLRYAGVRHINFDLLYGLPGQRNDDVADTIAASLRLHPERIAMFGYAHMPRLLPRQRMIDAADLPGVEARLEQSAIARSMLTSAGYRAIGFDHFAVPTDSLALAAAEGRLHRNFQGFTDEAVRAVIGLGASAISQYDGLLVQNEKHVGRYRGRTRTGLVGVRGVLRSAEARLRGAVIERLLCDGRVDVAAIARSMAMSPEPLLPAFDALGALVAIGVVTADGWCVALAPWAWPYARIAAAAFDSYRTAGERRFSRAV